MTLGTSTRPLAVIIALMASCGFVSAVDIEGFTEPERTVRVAAADAGIVAEVPVDVGDYVQAGQVIARLDDRIHKILVASARQQKDARGRLLAAKAEVRLRRERLAKLVDLRGEGFGRKEEVSRATTDLEIAEADYQSVIEDLAEKQSRYDKAKADLERRTVVAPVTGYVTERNKQPGEYVAATDPYLVTIVSTKTMLAKISVVPAIAHKLKLGQDVAVSLGSQARRITGVVDQIAPVLDAQSGTVRIKVRLANAKNDILGGQHCVISLPGTSTATVRDEPTEFDRITRRQSRLPTRQLEAGEPEPSRSWAPRATTR